VVLLHGFTQNSGCWGRFRELLASGEPRLGTATEEKGKVREVEVVALDLPGHGTRSGVQRDLPGSADLVAKAGGRGIYVGYSLGARVLLHVLLLRPEVAAGAVLIGATAGIEDPEERARRVRSDEVRAREVEGTAGDPEGFEGFLRRWLSGPLFAGLDEETGCLAERLLNDPRGLAGSLRLCGTGTQIPLWAELPRIRVPVLVLAGERDERFKILGNRIAGSVGSGARFEEVPGAHHACHLENPEETARIVREFLQTRIPIASNNPARS
jgi:2-succinyl-6-hydroxy-2,4-cyclohexadiene-1-carboxylate synthase